jgi:hypothetical protein
MRTVYANDPKGEYDKEDLELELKAFQKFFPGKRLLALCLDGFSHRVIYDDVPKTPKAHAVYVSFYMGEAEEMSYAKTDEDRAKLKAARGFLTAIGLNTHVSFQGNPKEIIYVNPEDR